MEQNRITDKDLQMILDYFKQFQIRLSDMNIDDLMLKLKENRLTDKEKAKIDEDFATMRHPGPDVVPVEEFRALLRKFRHEKRGPKPADWPFPNDMDFTKHREDIEAIIKKLRNDDSMFTKDEVNKLANALLHKMSFSIMHSVRGASEDIWYYWIHGHWPKGGPNSNEFLQDHFFEPFRCHLTPEQIDAKIAKLLELKKRAGVVPTDDEMFGNPKPDQFPIPNIIHANPVTRDDVFTDEEIAAIIEAANMPRNGDEVLTQAQIDAIVEAMTAKLREAKEAGPVLTQEQIDALIKELTEKSTYLPNPMTQEELEAMFAKITDLINQKK